MSKRALITGISGQDGAYLARLLLEKGYNVFGTIRLHRENGLDNLEYLNIIKNVTIFECDLLDTDSVRMVFDRSRPEEIYNLAAVSSVGYSFGHPAETFNFNVMSVLNILEYIRLNKGSTKLYQASSSEMFGRCEDLPITENATLAPASPYGASKAAAHLIAKAYREMYGLYICCGILFNHESFLRGAAFVTKKIITAAVAISSGDKKKIRLGNLDVKRDWGYAPEYVKAMWLMMQQDKASDYVVATGRSYQLRDFVRIAFEKVGLSWEEWVDSDPSLLRPSEIEDIYGDAAKARNVLGWHYTLTLDELIEKLIKEQRVCQ